MQYSIHTKKFFEGAYMTRKEIEEILTQLSKDSPASKR